MYYSYSLICLSNYCISLKPLYDDVARGYCCYVYSYNYMFVAVIMHIGTGRHSSAINKINSTVKFVSDQN